MGSLWQVFLQQVLLSSLELARSREVLLNMLKQGSASMHNSFLTSLLVFYIQIRMVVASLVF